jgi:hypothetical protein
MSDQSARDGYVKVGLTDNEGKMTETVWAVTVGPNRFRLDNVPWFAYGISLGDVVEGAEYAPDTHAQVADYLVASGVTWEYANPTWDDLLAPPGPRDVSRR